jgi:hypothetical protein
VAGFEFAGVAGFRICWVPAGVDFGLEAAFTVPAAVIGFVLGGMGAAAAVPVFGFLAAEEAGFEVFGCAVVKPDCALFSPRPPPSACELVELVFGVAALAAVGFELAAAAGRTKSTACVLGIAEDCGFVAVTVLWRLLGGD